MNELKLQFSTLCQYSIMKRFYISFYVSVSAYSSVGGFVRAFSFMLLHQKWFILVIILFLCLIIFFKDHSLFLWVHDIKMFLVFFPLVFGILLVIYWAFALVVSLPTKWLLMSMGLVSLLVNLLINVGNMLSLVSTIEKNSPPFYKFNCHTFLKAQPLSLSRSKLQLLSKLT